MKNERNLRYDIPKTQGEKNVLRRTKQLLHFTWKPLMECTENEREYIVSARNGKQQGRASVYQGIPYSSCRVEDKFAGLDILLETFASAVKNPASVIYTRDLSDFDDPAFNCAIKNTFLAYGTVCSAFTNYALDLPIHRCTREWDISPEFYLVEKQSADGLCLCDTLLTTRPNGRTGGHVRIVTGIARDEDGCVRRVQISEGMPPFPKCRWFTAEEFNATLKEPGDQYRIYRYKFLDRVTYRPFAAEKTYAVLPDLGDYSNYRLGDNVTLNVLRNTGTLVVKGPETSREIPVASIRQTTVLGRQNKLYVLKGLPAGNYRTYCRDEHGDSAEAEFCVYEPPKIYLEDEDGNTFPFVYLKPVSPDGSALSDSSSCFYDGRGALKTEGVEIALTDGKNLYPARAAVTRKCNGLVVRPAAFLWDKTQKPVHSFAVGEDVTFCMYRAKENVPCAVRFSGGKSAEPYFLSWKEEGAVAYLQREFTEEEKQAGLAKTKIIWHDNPFSRFTVFSRNSFGRFASDYLPVLVERE